MTMKQDEKLQKLIDTVAQALASWEGRVSEGRAGLSLKAIGLAEKFENNWGRNGYYLLQRGNHTLTDFVYEWTVAHGLKVEADKYNANARKRFWDENSGKWKRERERLMKERERIEREIRDIEANIARYAPAPAESEGSADDR